MSKFTKIRDEKKSLLENFFISHGYEKNRFGHWWKISSKGNKIRFRFMDRVIRREVYVENNKTWRHSHSASYQDVGVMNDKISGFKLAFFF